MTAIVWILLKVSFLVVLTPFSPELTRGPSKGTGSLCIWLRMEQGPRGAVLAASSNTTHGVSFFPPPQQAASHTHTRIPPSHPPSFAGCWRSQGHFLHPGNVLPSTTVSSQCFQLHLEQAALFQRRFKQVECGWGFHQYPWIATTVHSKAKKYNFGGYEACSSKFRGCNNGGEESRCMLCLLYFFPFI